MEYDVTAVVALLRLSNTTTIECVAVRLHVVQQENCARTNDSHVADELCSSCIVPNGRDDGENGSEDGGEIPN